MKKRISYSVKFKVFLGVLICMLIGFNLFFPPNLKAINKTSSIVLDKDGKWLSAYSLEDGTWRIGAPLTEIDPRFLERLIAFEDKRFYRHSGVDGLAILRAGRSWISSGEVVSGASTLTMQLVRLIEPRPRTVRSKIIECFRALQLELFLSKTEILEAYLTHAPYGGNLQGIYAASQAYFGKPPNHLMDAEIALLIALPQSPEVRRPDLRQKGARRGRAHVLNRLQTFGLMTDQQVKEANETPLPKGRLDFPEMAWITGFGLKGLETVTQSTLDKALQEKVETITQTFVSALDYNVNTAITLVENKTMAVRAHIASADRDRPGGWIDMTRRKRSPGSTLKPFVYGIAMDDGLISSASILHDSPTRFGSYQPENFNRRYHGNVRVFEALRHSLNVPAVAVLDQIGGQRFEDILVSMGIDLKRSGRGGERAGLALALGGTGITVNDLAMLYAGIANAGKVSDLRWRRDDEMNTRRLFLQRTADDMTDILKQSPTPSGRVPSWLSKNAPPIAYKTGTSYGFRDAWAAGYTKDWTVIVWVGRADGGPRPGQTGRIAAAPLLFDLFSLLPGAVDRPVFNKDKEAPKGLKSLKSNLLNRPQIIFPPHQSELYTSKLGPDGRGFVFSAQSDSKSVRFFVDGKPVNIENGQFIWRPQTVGFYNVTAIDERGNSAQSEIEVVTHIPS